MDSVYERFMSKVSTSDGCWTWTASVVDGYGQFRFNGKIVRAHRVSYLLHVGGIPNGMFVCHSCDNRKCVNPKHLFVGSDLDNKQDMYEKKRHIFGARHPHSKLTPEIVKMIREASKNGISQRDIAALFSTQRSQVSLIVNHKRWSSV